MRISGGLREDGIVVGNVYDKYGSQNPIVGKIMQGFHKALTDLVNKVGPARIHEIGCGEGYWVLHWAKQGIAARGSDFSQKAIELARQNAKVDGLPEDLFEVRSIYELDKQRDGADLVICCEVMEHLECPEEGLSALQRIVTDYLILSVPREPLWRLLNLARLKYVRDFGNTPGHVQHWSKRGFLAFASKFFQVQEVRTPVPWTMLLCRARH